MWADADAKPEAPRALAAVVNQQGALASKPGGWVEAGLTLPLFLTYQIGVHFLSVKNSTDFLTPELLRLAGGDSAMYFVYTAGIAALWAASFAVVGWRQSFSPTKLVQMVCEGAVYGVLLRQGASLLLANLSASLAAPADTAEAVVLSAGAGFYEELLFRVLVYGMGAKVLVWWTTREELSLIGPGVRVSVKSVFVLLVWASLSAALFAAAHHLGAAGEPWAFRPFFLRWLLGLAWTGIYAARGFGAAVWSHAFYDLYVFLVPG